jgi:XRE family transcriptional regulator, regulator of sulfur utilization
MSEVLQRYGVDVCRTEYGKQLGGGLFEFRLGNDSDELIAKHAVEVEAKAEGPEAVAQFERLQHRYYLGGQIAMLRAHRGMSQEELLAKTGIDQSEISKIERGMGNPTEDTLANLGHALGVRLAYVSEREAVAV